MKRLLVLFIIMVIFNCILLPDQEKSRQDNQKYLKELQIQKVRKSMLEAIKAHDFQTMENLYSDQYTWISWKGILRNKKDRMAMLHSGELRYLYHHEKDVKIIIQECAAIVTGIATTQVIKDGKKFPRITKRFLEMFVQENGKWVKIARQATRLE